MAVNKVILVGNVGKDPDTRYLDENTAVTKFPLATSEVYKNRNGERVEQTEWHNIVLWRGLAKVAEQYVKKGSQLYIEGRIRSRSYDDKEGNKRYITEIVGDVMQMLGSRGDNSQQGGSSAGGQTGAVQGTPDQSNAPQGSSSSQGSSAPQGSAASQGSSAPQGSAATQGGNSPQSTPASQSPSPNQNSPQPGGPDLSSGDADDDLPF